MENIRSYFNFIRGKGRYVSEINPGSVEIALKITDALEAMQILMRLKIPVVGGDILSERNEKLIYAYQLWGDSYIYLNWSCDRKEDENKEGYLTRSHSLAKESMVRASNVAEQFNDKCFVVIVI